MRTSRWGAIEVGWDNQTNLYLPSRESSFRYDVVEYDPIIALPRMWIYTHLPQLPLEFFATRSHGYDTGTGPMNTTTNF
jgi:hypothetical protein